MNRPTRLTFIGFGIVTALAVWMSWAKAQKLDAGSKDFDLVCAVVSAAQVGTAQEGSEERILGLHVHWFYIGRLSARDDTTNWITVITGRLAELKNRARAPDLYGDCLVFATKKIQP